MSDDDVLKRKILASRRYFCVTCGNLVDGNEAVWQGPSAYHPACAPSVKPVPGDVK